MSGNPTATREDIDSRIELAILATWRSESLKRDGPLVVAFSGGGDSLALLAAFKRLTAGGPLRGLEPVAVHLDHALDPDSRTRCAAAHRLADQLGVRFLWRRCGRNEIGLCHATRSQSTEARAREIRYQFLERVRRLIGASVIVTAHHSQDQLETIFLRIARGSRARGLAGIRRRLGRVVRPLLGIDPVDLRRSVESAGLEPCVDPTNLDLAIGRNRIRHAVLPTILAAETHLPRRAVALAEAAARSAATLDTRIADEVCFRPDDLSLNRQRLERLPLVLWTDALRLLHGAAGMCYPASRAAERELRRQLLGESPAARVGCRVDCGAGWSWCVDTTRLRLVPRIDPDRERHEPPQRGFAYRLVVPGELWIPELQRHFRMAPGPTAEWMFRRSSRRAGLRLPLRTGEQVTVRTRRPGDRLRPLGCSGTKKLKAVLIDNKVPREARAGLPLLAWRDHILWVPGVAIDERCRIPRSSATDLDECSEEPAARRRENDHAAAIWVAEWSTPLGSRSLHNPDADRLRPTADPNGNNRT